MRCCACRFSRRRSCPVLWRGPRSRRRGQKLAQHCPLDNDLCVPACGGRRRRGDLDFHQVRHPANLPERAGRSSASDTDNASHALPSALSARGSCGRSTGAPPRKSDLARHRRRPSQGTQGFASARRAATVPLRRVWSKSLMLLLGGTCSRASWRIRTATSESRCQQRTAVLPLRWRLPVRKSDAAQTAKNSPHAQPIGACRVAERRAGKPEPLPSIWTGSPGAVRRSAPRTSGCQACAGGTDRRSLLQDKAQIDSALRPPPGRPAWSAASRRGRRKASMFHFFSSLLFSSPLFCPHRFRTDCGHLSFASCVSLAFLVLCPALCRLPVMLRKPRHFNGFCSIKGKASRPASWPLRPSHQSHGQAFRVCSRRAFRLRCACQNAPNRIQSTNNAELVGLRCAVFQTHCGQNADNFWMALADPSSF